MEFTCSFQDSSNDIVSHHARPVSADGRRGRPFVFFLLRPRASNVAARLASALIAVLMLAALPVSPAVAQPLVLARMDFSVLGVRLDVLPDYQAVPKGIASQVVTVLTSGGAALSDEVAAQLPKDYVVKAELSGPAFHAPFTLTTYPGQPFNLPTLPITGKYTLGNIRLVDGVGQSVFAASPQAVIVESINDPLVTSVTTRQLTLEEIRDRGVTVEGSNFTAYEFTAAIATESGSVPINFPVLIPSRETFPNNEKIPPVDLNLNLPSVEKDLPEVAGFIMEIVDDAGQYIDPAYVSKIPPIPGVVMIPGNIGFLHQYFSALVLVTNGAPGQSNLVVRDLRARIITPAGEDLVPGTDDQPGDDPVRMAKGADGYFLRIMDVMNAGPDAKASTVDDVSLLHPTESGQGDFTVEGLKEGTHKLDFEITATLEGLPIGPVQIKGKASGTVLVRNPDFAVTLGHPATIRSGEAYDLFVNITNTSKATANLVSVHLDQRALSGAVFADNETVDKQIDTIPPGSSGLVKFRLVAQRTGKVTATAFASEDIKGRFILRAGVGELGIPLSPDSLIVPYTRGLPSGLVDAAVGLLGQAWSVATAPSGAMPPDVAPIGKKVVSQKANALSEAGLRIALGGDPLKGIEELSFDLFGSDAADAGFDSLRRRSTQGLLFNNALSSAFAQGVSSSGTFGFQAALADLESYRPSHISVITSPAPVWVRITDSSGTRTGGLAQEEALREIPYADRLTLFEDGNGTSTLTLLSKLDSSSYLAEFAAASDAAPDIGVVVPGLGGALRQLRFAAVSLPADAMARLRVSPGSGTAYLLEVDNDNDGTIDAAIEPSSDDVIPDAGPQAVSVAQLSPGIGPGGDKHGRNVAVLFSGRVTKESAQDIRNYAVADNEARLAFLQPSGKMAFVLLRDGIGPFVERNMTVSGLVDLRGSGMSPASATLPIRTAATGTAAMVSGVARTARGEPVPGALVRLEQLVWTEEAFERAAKYFIFSEKPADANGGYGFDYVLKNDDPAGPFKIEAVNPATGEAGQITAGVVYNGQHLALDVFMKAKGSVAGTVRDFAGNPAAGASVLLKTLNDDRS